AYDDREVEPERSVLDVVQVVAHLLGFLIDVVGVAVLNLRPAGHAGSDGRSQSVIRDPLHEHFLIAHRMGTWPDQVHFTAQDVHQLWELVDSETTQHATGSRDAIEVVLDPLRAMHFGGMHRSELPETERLAVLAGAILEKQNG